MTLPNDVAKDAARYRWLRQRVGVDRYGINAPGLGVPNGDLTDASIDAMLSKAPEPPR